MSSRQQRRAERRAKYLAFLGGKCSLCGSPEQLEFDHLDPKNKHFKIADILELNDSRIESEVNKCQLLCKPCHHQKTLDKQEYGKPSAHGTLWRYIRHKCRCPKCRTRMNNYQRERAHR